MKSPQQEINDAFNDFVKKFSPTVVKDSPKHQALHKTFIAGAFTMVEFMSRPHEGIAQADWVAAIMQICEKLAGVVDEGRRSSAETPHADVNEDQFVRDHLQEIARGIKAALPEGWALFVFCAPSNERPGRANYLSNMTRKSALACMKEFIAKQTDGTGFGTHEP